ncbi:MAG TPA: FAD-dependent oxidoreductase, partial [Gemmatimonadales bacterium]|nr:FAD-dependent oxidoreductase [Gemmatimonadales bacterium]
MAEIVPAKHQPSLPMDRLILKDGAEGAGDRMELDVLIVGAGPAGLAAAVRAHDLGKTVALVDGGRAGGAGVWDGALSSKTLWHLAGDYARARRDDRGYHGTVELV